MEKEYSYLLHLLGAFLREEAPEVSDAVDWQKLLQLARIHGVPGILGYMGRTYPICSDPQMKAQLRSLCMHSVAVFARRNVQANAVTAELEKTGIDHILMKGYVLRDYYPVPELRSFNDIDIVIHRSDRKRCDERMLELGFQRHTDWEPVYSYFRDNELYEIHTEIMEIDVSKTGEQQAYFRKYWEYARPVREHSYRFTPEFHFLYLLTHIAKHVHGSGAGIRMYLDAAAFIRHYGDSIDWEWIRQELKKLKLSRFADVVFTGVEDWFGICCPFPFDRVTRDVIEPFLIFTMEAGVFGHYQRDTAVTALKHEDSGDESSRFRQVLRKTFPKAETIRSRYTYLQDKPWLLPAAWVHRLIKNKDKLKLRTRQMQQILEADSEEVRKMRDLMREIGL